MRVDLAILPLPDRSATIPPERRGPALPLAVLAALMAVGYAPALSSCR